MSTPTPRQEFRDGARDTIPLIAGAIPFGIIYGAIAVTGGLSITATLAMSLTVFAGSAQFIATGLVIEGTGVLLIVITTAIVNLRHMLYSASLGPYLKHLSQRWLAPLAFWLTDETYAITITRYENHPTPHRHWYQLGSAVAMYVNWNICTLIGIIAGTQLEGMAEWGLDFAMVVTFIGIIVPLIVTRPMVVCALTAGVVSIAAYNFPHNLGLMTAAIAGIIAGVLAEYRMAANSKLPLKPPAPPSEPSEEPV